MDNHLYRFWVELLQIAQADYRVKNQLDHSPQPHDYGYEIDKARRELLNIARPGLYQVIVNGKPVQVTVFGYLTAYGEYGDYRHLADYASCYDYVAKTDYLSVQDIKKVRKIMATPRNKAETIISYHRELPEEIDCAGEN